MAAKSKTTEAPAKVKAEKAPKVTARDQGIPEVYLSESGSFKPGYDAKLKSDLIKAVIGDGRLHVFNEKDALAILESRGWMSMLAKSQAARNGSEA